MFGPTINTHQGVAWGIFDYHIDTGNCGKCLYIILHQSSKCLWTLDPTPQNKVVVDLLKIDCCVPSINELYWDAQISQASQHQATKDSSSV